MTRLLGALLLCSLAGPVFGAEPGTPATLTSKEIAEGWILLFDGETLFGWNAVNNSQWTIADGLLAPQAGSKRPLVTTTAFADFELSLEYRSTKGGEAKLLVGCDAQGKNSGQVTNTLSLEPRKDGWERLRVTVKGSDLSEWSTKSTGPLVGGLDAPGGDKPAPTSGHIAIAGNGVVVRNIKLLPAGMKPLFNGKDLSGWKEFPGKKSKFSVTGEGWLHLKDGPGDLQTQGQWAGFVLQASCRTNGDFLNSGIFFRCRPDEYQQGYEAQIHNRFDPEPKKEYTLEEYDPRTHELTGKKKVKFTAQDYGTGAIYRRQPARKQVAKDREWFTMTIAAQGRHFAVWVDGYPVTDWTDNRPLKDNARNGCRLEKGPISLQGHDATTDLNFRNIRIAELPAATKK